MPHSILFKIDEEPVSKKSPSASPFLSTDQGMVPFLVWSFNAKFIANSIDGHRVSKNSLFEKVL